MLIQNGRVSDYLVELVRLQGIVVPEEVAPHQLNDLLQREWVKAKDGTLRAQLGGRFPMEEEAELLEELGAAAIPINFGTTYSGILLLGGTMKAVARRMQFLADQFFGETGCSVSHLCYVGSDRPLDVGTECMMALPTIEVDTGFRVNYSDTRGEDIRRLMSARWPEVEAKIFDFLVDYSVRAKWWRDRFTRISVCAEKPRGETRHPNTAEAVLAWATKPFVAQGRYLLVSSQPFCEGQKMAAERAVRDAGLEGFSFDVCGPAAPPLALAKWLDNLAKQVWEEVRLLP